MQEDFLRRSFHLTLHMVMAAARKVLCLLRLTLLFSCYTAITVKMTTTFRPLASSFLINYWMFWWENLYRWNMSPEKLSLLTLMTPWHSIQWCQSLIQGKSQHWRMWVSKITGADIHGALVKNTKIAFRQKNIFWSRSEVGKTHTFIQPHIYQFFSKHIALKTSNWQLYFLPALDIVFSIILTLEGFNVDSLGHLKV